MQKSLGSTRRRRRSLRGWPHVDDQLISDLAAELEPGPADAERCGGRAVPQGVAEAATGPRGWPRRAAATDRGRARCGRGGTVPPPPMLAALETLPEADRDAMQRGLVGLIRALQMAQVIPVQRICDLQAFSPHAPRRCGTPASLCLCGCRFWRCRAADRLRRPRNRRRPGPRAPLGKVLGGGLRRTPGTAATVRTP